MMPTTLQLNGCSSNLKNLITLNSIEINFARLSMSFINQHHYTIDLPYYQVEELDRKYALSFNVEIILKFKELQSININAWPVSFIRNIVSAQNRISKVCLCNWSGTVTSLTEQKKKQLSYAQLIVLQKVKRNKTISILPTLRKS